MMHSILLTKIHVKAYGRSEPGSADKNISQTASITILPRLLGH